MDWAGAVQAKGEQSVLWALMYLAMARSRSGTDSNEPLRMRRRVMAEKKPSIALIQEAEVGVKWKTHRG